MNLNGKLDNAVYVTAAMDALKDLELPQHVYDPLFRQLDLKAIGVHIHEGGSIGYYREKNNYNIVLLDRY